jgi:predicted ribosome quality control (RQC) complex YloA/Tae2 family protein
MLSLTELRKAVDALAPMISGAKVQRVIQPDEHTLVLELYGWDDDSEHGAKRRVILSSHPRFGRICTVGDLPKAPPWPPDFAALLKARLPRAKVGGLRVVNDDRMASLLLETKEGRFEILLSLLGTRGNTFLLDENGKLIGAMRALDTTRSDLQLGAAWRNPTRPPTTESGHDRWPQLTGRELLAAIEAHYAREELEQACEQLRHELSRSLEKEFDFASRKVANLRKDLEDAKDAREKKRLGELLKTVMAGVKQGDDHAMARDFETNEPVRIPLDPQLSPADNLDRYFKRYHKGLVGANMLGQQLEITQSHLNEITALRAELQGITTLEALQELARRPAVHELRKRHFPDEKKAARPPKKRPTRKIVPNRLLPRRYRTTDGMEVWVGRSDESNDYLTTKLANGNDWFFHIEGYPGSHTVLRTDGRKDPPQESVLEAAELCVHFSKMKDARRVNVHVVPIKNVSKPKGAKPGLVYVSQGKSIDLRRDPKRLERIMNARVEEQS